MRPFFSPAASFLAQFFPSGLRSFHPVAFALASL